MTAARRAGLAASGALAAALLLFAFGDSRSGDSARSAPGGPPLVAVLPFDVAGMPALGDLRDVIQELIAARFDGGDGGLRAVDATAVREAVRRATPSGAVGTRDVTRQIAAALGAVLLLRGSVSGGPEALSIHAELISIGDGSVLARAQESAGADGLAGLADRLTAHLLAGVAARDSAELGALTSASPAALRAYLAGMHAQRRGRGGTPSEAMAHFQRALSLDSSFTLAALRMSENAPGGMAELEERWRLDTLWSRRSRLSEEDRALLQAYVGPRYPQPATLVELIDAANQATLIAPHRVEAWRVAGRTLFSFGPMIGYGEWDTRARESFLRGLAIDSTDAVTLEHLILLAAAAGDRAAVERYARLYMAYNPQAYQAEAIRWVSAIIRDDASELAALREGLEQRHRFFLRALVEWGPRIAVRPGDADRAARAYAARAASVEERRAAIVGVVPYLLNRGRPREASRLLATAERGFGDRADVGVLEFRVYAALFWDGDTTEGTAAARALEAHLGGAPARLGYVRDRQTAACALAHWRLAHGDATGAGAALRVMRRLAATSVSSSAASNTICAAALDARLAELLHRPDSSAALDRLDTLLRAGAERRYLVPTVANVVSARLHEARGDLPGARVIMQRRNRWGNQLLSLQLREEGRLSALLGDTSAAVRAYRHYLLLRSDPEPTLLNHVERARAELAQLERRAP